MATELGIGYGACKSHFFRLKAYIEGLDSTGGEAAAEAATIETQVVSGTKKTAQFKTEANPSDVGETEEVTQTIKDEQEDEDLAVDASDALLQGTEV